jgi:hypothetical protein
MANDLYVSFTGWTFTFVAAGEAMILLSDETALHRIWDIEAGWPAQSGSPLSLPSGAAQK